MLELIEKKAYNLRTKECSILSRPSGILGLDLPTPKHFLQKISCSGGGILADLFFFFGYIEEEVHNLLRLAEEFLDLAAAAGIHTTTRTYNLDEANQALSDLRSGALEGAAVLVP